MNTYIFRHLSAKHRNFSTNKLHLDSRISSDCLFNSVESCLDYLEKVCLDTPINLDDVFFVSYLDYPILYVNIIDESICSMIYQGFQLRRDKCPDLLAYYRNKIDEFIDMLRNMTESKDKTIQLVRSALIVCLSKVSVIFNPTSTTEELLLGELPLYYYNLLYTIYSQLSNGKEDRYMTKCRDLYKMYIEQSYKQYAPMALSNNIYKGDSIYAK